jgi:hydrogenase expression/formation protein HypE
MKAILEVRIELEIGKIPNDILKRIVLDNIKHNRNEVLVRPAIGEDCSVVDFGESVCVLSSDPITGAINEVGRLAVHISCNDVASCGVGPLGLIITILAPEATTESELDFVMKQICDAAHSINVDIIGGHTEITTAVNRIIIITTAVGKMLKDKLVTTSGAQPGDYIVMTKTAGLEGTAIIAADREEELIKVLGCEVVNEAKSFINNISVVRDGTIAGGYGVSSMHDATEGGILGALWEVAEASGVGVVIYKKNLPIADATSMICEYYKIDPLKLISSGCMIITCSNGNGLVDELLKNNVKATIIGRITQNKEKLLVDGEREYKIAQPESDELYKVMR